LVPLYNNSICILLQWNISPHNCLLADPTQQTDKARADLAKAEGKFEQYRKDTANDALKKIDAADRKIEEGAAKAKSGISSWFGGK
jgi:hypothetical protein